MTFKARAYRQVAIHGSKAQTEKEYTHQNGTIVAALYIGINDSKSYCNIIH